VRAVRDVLTGAATSVTDFGWVRVGDRVTILLDGWQAEQLTVTVTEIKPPLDRHTGLTWLYGIDGGSRVRLVLTRCAPPTVMGRASVRQPAPARRSPAYPSLWDSDGAAHREEGW
jgi:hypothetical protein